MKIAIALTGRSHLLNVSRSLIEIGHEVTFYTCIPKSRCKRFGLPAENVVSLFPLLGWLFIYRKIKTMWLREMILSWLDYLVDSCVAWILRPCDVFIGASTVVVKSSVVAKNKYNATVICDCGTKHVLEQNKILSQIPSARRIAYSVIKRELKNYKFADYITVPSFHSMETFLKHGIPQSKLFRNPYGVDISLFGPTMKPAPDQSYDVIIIGTWRYIKGVDLLSKVCTDMGLNLLHVGGQFANCPFPNTPLFTHVPPVDEKELTNYYAKAKVFVLPSRAEGLALVLAQAVVSQLSVVYSKDTGGHDIKKLIEPKGDFMFEMESFSEESLKACIEKALMAYQNQPDGVPRNYTVPQKLEKLTWTAYGQRYETLFDKLIHE